MIDTDKYEAAICGPMWKREYGNVVKLVYPDWGGPSKKQQYIHGYKVTDALTAEQHLITDAPLLLAEVKRLRQGIMFFLEIDRQPTRAELLELIE